ncbi:MAG: DEAD/DEAH box helicase family protein [Chloroflexi bacterium]|uniref:DEAD/DEAH box helicase family protein n=1 Tax=Candidatus Chlorohelix allophototropha TaxID=3003348 RepID=A0A8T7M4D3_9CHLR|nr:DEAD/DEAH box helicase family protein [Chloroflexota bacterium]WJW70063.1 DEAD/DEAH box helicase family protein [Chloroflexota bacterium L227-S17]
MVADGILTFRLALPRNKLDQGDFHDKFGIFTDVEGNEISFNGSYNDSFQGTRNYESIKVFCSWESAYTAFVKADIERFERLWNNFDPNVKVFDLPEAARQQIIRLQTYERPYTKPAWLDGKKISELTSPYEYQTRRPALPEQTSLREYQLEAIKAWFEHGSCGILEMATGTGKTITALAAAIRLYERETRLLIIISCPFTHLVTQWEEVVKQFGFNTFLAFGTTSTWVNKLADKVLNFATGYINNLVVLTTHDTFSNPRFGSIFQEKHLPYLVIVDEVHDIGAPKRRQGLISEYKYRLGLSATPRRWLDEEGTDTIFEYFGETVFEFDLAKAIPKYLTPYEYYPYFVELSSEELAEYEKMTQKITKRSRASDESKNDEILKLYFILRQKIVVNARNKFTCLEEILGSLQNYDHTLVYCSPEQIDQVQYILNTNGIVQSRFTGEESLQERKVLLESFDKGRHEILVAMKCLDQGVDVPSTRTAVIMASSGNPKEFIQRRGRVLRKYEGKEKAIIYDIIVVPTLTGKLNLNAFELERKILKKELQRYDEFAGLALNRISALNKAGPVKRKYLIK